MLAEMARVRSALAGCADQPVWSLSDAGLLDALDAVHAAQAQLAGVLTRLVREVDGRGLSAAAFTANTAAFLRDRLRISPWSARKLVDLAHALDTRPALHRAVAAGTVNVEQATVIASTVTGLSGEPEVGPAQTSAAEAVLIQQAAQLDPAALRKVADRVLAHVAPDIAARVDAAHLARLEDRAHRSRELRLTPTGDGQIRLTGWLPVDDAATVNAALDPLCTPNPDDGRTPGQRRADALVDICRLALSCGELPVNGGDRPQVVVTVDYDQLTGRLGAGTLDTGERLSPAATRRWACDAQIIPAVLGAEGQVLDLGRSARLITGPLRRALVLRDGGCAFPGCDRPARWAQGHHIVHWEHGGPTSLHNSVLVCGPHHRLLHHSDWQVRLDHRGRPEFIPPATIDPQQRPRTNLYHRRL